MKSIEVENKSLSESLLNVKEEYSSLYNTFQTLSHNYNSDLQKVKDEKYLYKNSLETLKGAVDSEHELISNSLKEVFNLMDYLKENVSE